MLYQELNRGTDEPRRIKTIELLNLATRTVALDQETTEHAERLQEHGFGVFDSLHLALSGKAGATLLTVNDRMIRRALAIPELQIKVENPVDWLRQRKPWLIKR